jgi:sulfite reductase beta subunit-like hemoprotein
MHITLPAKLAADIAQFDGEVRQFQQHTLTADEFKHHRVIWGIYEQRRDGAYMLRTRIPGGRLSARQARAIAALSLRHQSRLHLSTRENIQFHDLPVGALPEIMRELLEAGIACQGGGGNTARNVVACPLAGLCRQEQFDVTPQVAAVTEHLLAQPGSLTLPRKFKTAFSGCGADCALATVTDIGFIAKVQDGVPGYAVYGGGGMGGAPRLAEQLATWLPAADCVLATEAVRRIFDQRGDRTNRARARLRFAVAKMAPGEFRALFESELARLRAASRPALPMAAVQGTGSQADTDGAPAVAPGNGAAPLAPPAVETVAGLRVVRQRQAGRCSVLLSIPFGHLTGSELAELADIATRYSAEAGVRATPNQSLIIPSVTEADLPALGTALRAMAPRFLQQGAVNHIVACTGAATCRLGICHSQEAAAALATALDQASLPAAILSQLDIRLNGCPNCCGQHPVGAIGLAGALQQQDGHALPAYRLHLGARRGEGVTRFGEYVATIPATLLPARIASLLQEFANGRLPDECLSDYFDRLGKAHFQSR